MLPPRIVRNYTSILLWKPKIVHSVPHYTDQVLKISMKNHNLNMIQFEARLQLHAIDPVAAA